MEATSVTSDCLLQQRAKHVLGDLLLRPHGHCWLLVVLFLHLLLPQILCLFLPISAFRDSHINLREVIPLTFAQLVFPGHLHTSSTCFLKHSIAPTACLYLPLWILLLLFSFE